MELGNCDVCNREITTNNIYWLCDEHLFTLNVPKQCAYILRRGPRIGQQCRNTTRVFYCHCHQDPDNQFISKMLL